MRTKKIRRPLSKTRRKRWTRRDSDSLERGGRKSSTVDCFKTTADAFERSILRLDLQDPTKASLLLECRKAIESAEASFSRNRRACSNVGNSARPLEMCLNEISMPVRKQTGTDRAPKGSAARMRGASERILSAVFMAAGEGILLVDEDFEIVKANQRAGEIYGVLERNLVGADIRSFTDAFGADRLTKSFTELIEGQRVSLELACSYVDGSGFPATLTATRIDLDGKRFWPVIVQDDTGRKSLENRLHEEKKQIEEMNVTLKNVLNSIEADRKELEARLRERISASLLPALKKIGKASDESVRKSYVALFEEQLLSLISGLAPQPDPCLLRLSRAEINVCKLVQAGCSTKEVCDALHLSFETVQTHRKNIRKKLVLNGSKTSLHAFLTGRNL